MSQTKEKKLRPKKTRRPERIIESGSIQQKTTVLESIIKNTVLCWNIKEYNRLKEGALYYKMYASNDFNCTFKLMKMRNNLYIALRCRISNRPSLFCLSNGDEASRINSSEEIVDGLYVAYFPQLLVRSPVGNLARTGVLTLIFSFMPEDEVRYFNDHDYSRLEEMSDVDVLCSNIRNMYFEGQNSDFVIETTDGSFEVHKFILAARSDYFEEFFSKRNHPREVAIDISSGTMHLVLQYCYSGELPRLDEAVLWVVLSVARSLKIWSLVKRCQKDLGVAFSMYQERLNSQQLARKEREENPSSN